MDSTTTLETLLQKVDPILQFLTKATGQTAIPAPTFLQALPLAFHTTNLQKDLEQLIDVGILYRTTRQQEHDDDDYHLFDTTSQPKDKKNKKDTVSGVSARTTTTWSWEDTASWIGFPPPDPKTNSRMHGSTKTAAKRRATALKQILKKNKVHKINVQNHSKEVDNESTGNTNLPTEAQERVGTNTVSLSPEEQNNDDDQVELDTQNVLQTTANQNRYIDQTTSEKRHAIQDLQKLFGFAEISHTEEKHLDSPFPYTILPQQASYAGSNPAQESVYENLSSDCRNEIPTILWKAFGFVDDNDGHHDGTHQARRLYRHQVAAIEAALSNQHCCVCTGTGSGKSLCFLLPVLTAAYSHNHTSLLLFPTKALAQDQLSKITALLSSAVDIDLSLRIRPITLDGDTPHSVRSTVSDFNIILTNPDTLHAAVLPSWNTTAYKGMLASIRYVIIDEAHTYDGIFGAHVAMILRRLTRIRAVAALQMGTALGGIPTFLSASATLAWPEVHFRLLCPIPNDVNIKVLTSKEDGSPRSAKHFFVWNPPVLQMDGVSTGKVHFPKSAFNKESIGTGTSKHSNGTKRSRKVSASIESGASFRFAASIGKYPFDENESQDLCFPNASTVQYHYQRRHAAEETARLLAQTVKQGVRCIAFCKTRNLVEWVYSKTLDTLKSDPQTAELVSKVDSYRGGYTLKERRKIEERLFRNEILGVVGTNTLELGVDIGGIDVTLHCGYPSSYTSLLQQVRYSFLLKFPKYTYRSHERKSFSIFLSFINVISGGSCWS